MQDQSSVIFAITYGATLIVALLMFIGQALAFIGLIVLAATARLLFTAVRAAVRARRKAKAARPNP